MDSQNRVIKKLAEFGEGFRHHHENYAVEAITRLRETGGVLELGRFEFHFPEHFGFCYGVDKAIDLVFETCERFSAKESATKPADSSTKRGTDSPTLCGERGARLPDGQGPASGGPGRSVFLTDQLIHNPYINGKLKEKGVQYLKRDAQNLLVCDDLRPEDVVVVSAFGTDFRDMRSMQARGVTIVDSTCGAIINVWKRVERYAKDGYITVVHGKRNHEETRATVSQALKEGGAYLTLENRREAEALADVIRGKMSARAFLEWHPGAAPDGFTFDAAACRMGMANQTTMLKGESLEIQEILRAAFVERFGAEAAKERFRSFDTICGATQDRQDALRKLLAQPLDLVLIVGGFNSSNTSHLAEIADGKLPYYHIESADDIPSLENIRARNPKTGKVNDERGWFPPNAPATAPARRGEGRLRIGITSGASTPDVTLASIIRKLCDLAGSG